MRKVATVLVAFAAVLVTQEAQGQQATRSGIGRASAPRAAAVQQGGGTGPTTTLFGGVATGDNGLDLGFVAGVSFTWDLAGLPIDLRFDPSISRYSGDGGPGGDVSLLQLNFPAAVEYQIPTSTEGGTRFHVLGGIGMHYSNFSFDTSVPGFEGSDSGLDMGITLGGGARFNDKLGAEARILDIDSFTSIYLLATWRLR
ncbi:MAG: outer membrane beta-barrel protein [Gemmatimonadota bacterium]